MNAAYAFVIAAVALPLFAFASGPVVTFVAGEAAAADPKVVRREAPVLAAIPREAVRELLMSAPSPAAVARLGEMPSGSDKRLRIGIARDVVTETEHASGPVLAWRALPTGGLVARLQLRSPGAASLRVGIAARGLPDGAELLFQGKPQFGVVGPVSAAQVGVATREHGIYWSPVTEGDTQTIEVRLPAGFDPSLVRLDLESASHLAGRPVDRFRMGKEARQSCHEDVACLAPNNSALAQVARSVAKMVVTENGVSYLCTGTLVNDADRLMQIPYFHTAAHCVDTQAAAATLNTFWFFEAASCGGKAAAGYRQLSGGARLLYANPETDAALLRLTERAPEGAWFAGWDATALAEGTPLIGLHHPGGDFKKVSIGQALSFTAAAGGRSYATAAWLAGSTEAGSSGSGIFSSNGGEYVLRGGLRGGSASCSSTGRLADPANRDYYSRLDLDAPALRAWLLAGPAPLDDYADLWYDPAEIGWGVGVVQRPNGRVFMTWFTYDRDGRPTWLVMPDAAWVSAFAVEGTLYRGRGSGWDQPWDATRASVEPAGRARIDFEWGDRAVARFTVDGITVVKPIVRQRF